ncbi:MAG: glycine zipper 2TM domain-containing protein [Hydrogenophaga sp.]
MKTSFKPVLVPVLAGLIGLSASGLAQAQQERARVISSTPIVEQIAVPRDVCYDETVTRPGGRTGAGAIIGGIAGGAMGNAIGDGNGRALATMIGLVGGAVVGNHIEGPRPARTQVVRHCTTQTQYESRTVGYDVVYRYAGVKYRVQMPHDPGRFVQVDVRPAGYDRPTRGGYRGDHRDSGRNDHRPGAARGAVVHQVMHASDPQPHGWR